MKGRETPADGVVTGFGKVNGRWASVIAYDFTVMAGSMGRTAEVKCNRAREIALGKRMPMIWLIDSAGARIQEAIGSTFAQSGFLFREESIMSGVVPMVAAMMGPGAAGTAYIPALADFVPMVKGTSHMALGGPPLVKAVVGEEITAEEAPQRYEIKAWVAVARKGRSIGSLAPQMNYYPNSKEPIGGPAIRSTLVEDLYLTLIHFEKDGSAASLRVIVTPAVAWIWIGGIVMMAGGLLALSLGRRKREGETV
jgi:hypothetical protein